jgi:hypothetical protein
MKHEQPGRLGSWIRGWFKLDNRNKYYGFGFVGEANLDMFAEISLRLTVASFTPSSGSYLGIYVVPLLDDGSTYGDGTLTSGSTITRAPPYPLAGIVPLESSAAITVMAGFIPRIELPPNKFRFALFNNSGVSLSGTAGNNIVKYRTYDMNLNA